MGSWLRYLGGAVGFGFGAIWMTAGLGSAFACVLSAALGYGAVLVIERAQAEASRRRPNQTREAEADRLLPAEGFELDQERYDDEHDDATSPLAAEVEYGWPVSNVVEEPTPR